MNMVATGYGSYLNFALDTIIMTFGGGTPSVDLTPQKRSPHPFKTWRWGKLPIWTACIRRAYLLGLLALIYKNMDDTMWEVHLLLIDVAP